MPSPFPGMDPFFEGDAWTSFHATLAIEIARQLTPLLRPKYVARPQKRFESVESSDLGVEAVYPDVAVTGHPAGAMDRTTEFASSAPVIVQTIMDEEAPHDWIEIRDVLGRRLVATIEILSPWYKRGAGRTKYLKKRQTNLRGSSHLIEIDLLRAGRRLPMRKNPPPSAYYVYVCRANRKPLTEVWPIALNQPLPRKIPIPLLPGDDDVFLDLQMAFESTYDGLAFDESQDYTAELDPPLGEEQAAWVAERLRAAGKLE